MYSGEAQIKCPFWDGADKQGSTLLSHINIL
jgi:hypothetical protein